MTDPPCRRNERRPVAGHRVRDTTTGEIARTGSPTPASSTQEYDGCQRNCAFVELPICTAVLELGYRNSITGVREQRAAVAGAWVSRSLAAMRPELVRRDDAVGRLEPTQ